MTDSLAPAAAVPPADGFARIYGPVARIVDERPAICDATAPHPRGPIASRALGLIERPRLTCALPVHDAATPHHDAAIEALWEVAEPDAAPL